MGLPVLSYYASAVHRQYNMLIGNGHILHHLVISALQKCGIYRKNRAKSACRQSGAECGRMGFRDSDIIKTFRKF